MAETDELRRRAIASHGETWELLEKADRSEAETARMIGAAHTSLAAWQVAGGPLEAQRATWLVARVYAAAGLAEPAIVYAKRTMELTRQHQTELADFDLAFAKEIAARAWALAGNLPRAKEHYDGARKLGDAIKDDGDRKEFLRQIAIGPWFGIDAP